MTINGVEKLTEKIKIYYSGDLSLIYDAYKFAEDHHKGQIRKSGEPYIEHPLQVALILAELQMDLATIAAALLHDVVEDTGVQLDEIKKHFGDEIALLVDGVTKLGRLAYKSKMEHQAENLRKMFFAMSKDIRILLIKLADRLHNMRTLKSIEHDKQIEKARETLEIFAPLANRLGIFKIKWELEDLSFRFLEPEAYYQLVEKVAKRRNEREEYISSVISQIKEKLNSVGIDGEIQGRPKHFYSIYKKMQSNYKSFDQIFDLTAIRILVNNVKDCYGVLGIIHTLWKPIPGRFKDYIAMPKPNMYQSLHTTVVGPNGDPLEIQIRTYEMHKTAELGIAAHWKYKEGVKGDSNFEIKLHWLRELLEWQRETKDPREFMESLKIDLFTDEVFVFTPKGDVINLPNGSTPLDFAYRIHTDVGHKCVGAKVNGRIVQLSYKLNTGDIVEILTSTHASPSLDWLSIVKSSQAKTKIKHWFKKEKREESIEKGKDLFEKEGKRQGLEVFEYTKEPWFTEIIKRYNYNSLDDLYAGIGFGEITANKIILRMLDELKKRTKKSVEDILKKTDGKQQAKEKKNHLGISVKDIDNVMIRLSKCCNPVPGDEIIGYITRGRGVSVHRADCINVNALPDTSERIIEVEWEDEIKTSYPVDIKVWTMDRDGILSDIINVLIDSRIHISKVNARSTKDGMALMDLTLDITSLNQLKSVIDRIARIRDVIQVDRSGPH